MEPTHETWEQKAAAKRASILAGIPPQWRLSPADIERASGQRQLTGQFMHQYLEPEDISIVSMDSVPIVEAVRQGKLSSIQVATAFCKTAAIAHQINNCLHEVFFDQALHRARQLDDSYAQNGTTVGPLHGLPISLKDQFHVKGVDTNMGYVGWIGSNFGIKNPDQIHKVESQITSELLSLGAILYCKTSLPQTLLFGETKNNVIGSTLNPRNRNLSCGGSSGGEGALQALRGSSVGIGTDIGGSVRIPAAFNGVFALKPTPERLSYRDVANTNPGQNTCRSTVGFLSTSIEGLRLVLEAVLETKPWVRDPAVVPIPFRGHVVDEYLGRAGEDGSAKPGGNALKLGVLWTDGVVGPHPPVTRGLRMVVDAVEKAGHKVPSSLRPVVITQYAFIQADGAHDIHEQLKLSGEPLLPDLRHDFEPRDPIGLLKYQDLTLQSLDFEARYSDYWNSTADLDGQIVDAVIMPVAPHAAVIPGKYYHLSYTEALNLMNYSVVVIPVTAADKALDAFDHAYRPLSELDEKNWRAYDPEIYHDGPVGVQIVARKFEEEKVWAIAKIVHKILLASKIS
ncbi:amidase [Xylariaceae sp. AK1471]|nr:amidase [Xylariaceae sp. AK1471]